jgi:hypothetical protein
VRLHCCLVDGDIFYPFTTAQGVLTWLEVVLGRPAPQLSGCLCYK